ncbi:MAG: 50S ribosomal protein L25/general stress protein Ctc [Bacteroidales bacterium]|jgi:large subunit ribosomal protein L25|nr:50S ribosomal protein L25/general stress protein Ctc [Bacteroidales bacterium]
MESIALKASLRKEIGKKSSKAIRAQEGIPCVLYGGEENVNFFATESDFRHLIFTPSVYIVNIDVDGKSHNAIIKDLQFHPVTDKLLHADFYEISDSKPITVEIPVKLTGSSMGVREGGRLVMECRKIKVKGLSKDIPAEIEVDVTELGIGKSIRAGEIKTNKFDVVLARETPIVSVRTTRAAAAAAQEAAKQA